MSDLLRDNFGVRPILTPRAMAATLPAVVRSLMSDRSRSASTISADRYFMMETK